MCAIITRYIGADEINYFYYYLQDCYSFCRTCMEKRILIHLHQETVLWVKISFMLKQLLAA